MKHLYFSVIVILFCVIYLMNISHTNSINEVDARLTSLEKRMDKSEKLIFIDRNVKEEIIDYIQ